MTFGNLFWLGSIERAQCINVFSPIFKIRRDRPSRGTQPRVHLFLGETDIERLVVGQRQTAKFIAYTNKGISLWGLNMQDSHFPTMPF